MYVFLKKGKAHQLIPLTREKILSLYGVQFLSQCIEYEGEVSIGDVYNYSSGTFSPPKIEYSPPSLTIEELQKENKLLKAQLQASVDRSEFIEDCIAEMATVVYGGV